MGYARLGEIEHSISLFKKMQLLGVEGDVTTFGSLMNACSDFSDPRFGRMIHAFIYQRGWDVAVEFGDVQGALPLFLKASETNVVSWTAMISGFARNGYWEGALSLFIDMKRNSLTPDDFRFGAIFHACGMLAVLANGRMAHSCMIR
ncbi:pentatricopeptide repeat-containing protein At4g21065-like [Elaeis guineensis]|uniref:pentatricopeptide repeat-containing protein At4g21065-like n=1 Tax=Elaeis guineensis var. tenera TaxID=51953 RepID=UPI003C6D3E92